MLCPPKSADKNEQKKKWNWKCFTLLRYNSVEINLGYYGGDEQNI